jgi:RNA polymerase sigma factor (sigma-70 family)
MSDARRLYVVDRTGVPFSPRVEKVLVAISTRLRRRFPFLRDDAVMEEILEETGRRVVEREQRGGAISKFHAYAWVTARSVAISHSRRADSRIQNCTLRGGVAEICLASARSVEHTAEQIELAILRGEFLAQLRSQEREVVLLKQFGFSTREIARRQRRSPSAVDAMYSRAVSRLRHRNAG